MAVPPRATNPGAAHGGLAADKRAPHVNAFPNSENLENHLSAQEKYIKGEEKSEKIHGGGK
jgi:hypothetical protein